MKNIIIILVAVLSSNNLVAQDYVKLYDFSNYIGTWKYETEHEVFIMKIKEVGYIAKRKTPTPEHYLIGAYKYIKEGVVIYDYLDNLDKYIPNDAYNYKTGCMSFYVKPENTQDLWVYHKDRKTINYTSYDSYLRTHTFNPDQLIFHIEPDMWERDTEAFDENGNWFTITDPERLNGFTIPTDMILTRIE